MKNMYGKELYFPEDVYYSEELLWVKPQGGNKVRVGISELAVRAVKDLVHVKITLRVDAKVAKGDSMGYVETTKGVWEVIAPLSGTVVEINPPIKQGNANPIYDKPYGHGWLIDIETEGDAESEVKALRNGSDEETKKWILEKVEELVPLMEEDDDDDD